MDIPKKRPDYDKPNIQLGEKIKGIETIKSREILQRLIDSKEIRYRHIIDVVKVVSKFLEEVKKEVGKGKKVKVHGFGFFYPAELHTRVHYCPMTGKRTKKRRPSTVIRLRQSRNLRGYFRANFKGIKWKETKK